MFPTVEQLRQLVKDRVVSNARSANLARAIQTSRTARDDR